MEHHEICGDQRVLVVEETAHVGIYRKGCGFHPCEPLAEVPGEIDDSVHLPFLHQPLRLLHVHALGLDLDFPCGVDLADEAAAVGAGGIVHHGYRGVGEDPVRVDDVVQQRIGEAGHEEDQQHPAVMEYFLHLVKEDVPPVRKPVFQVSFHGPS